VIPRKKKRPAKHVGLEFGPKHLWKHSAKTALIAQLDRAFSVLVRKRDRMCLYCKMVHDHNKLYCHHIFSRKHHGTRWDFSNAVTLCFSCHDGVAHTDPEIFREWLIDRMGIKAYERLKFKAMSRTKFTVADLRMIKFDLQKQLKRVT